MLSEDKKLKLGEECKCQRCGKDGHYMIEPYSQNMFDEENLVCYCPECEIDSVLSV